MKKNNKKTLKLKILSLAVVGTLAISSVNINTSRAQMIVFDPANAGQWIADFAVQMATWYQEIEAYLRQDAQSTYDKITNDLLKLQMSQDVANVEEDDARERRMQGDILSMQNDIRLMPTPEACAEAAIPFNAALSVPRGRGGTRGNPAPGPVAAINAIILENEYRNENTRTAFGAAQFITDGKDKLGTCEGTNTRNGCSGDGTLPGADKNSEVFFGALEKSGASVTGEGNKQTLKKSNNSMDGTQVDIASKAAANIVGFRPNNLTKKQKESKNADIYQAKLEIIQARQSLISSTYADITAMRTAADFGSPDAKSKWEMNLKPIYQQAFKNYKAPEMPSFIDFTSADIMYDLSKLPNSDSPDATLATAKGTNRNNLLMLELIKKQDRTNALLAALLAQQLDPVTPADFREEHSNLNTTSAK